MSKTHAIAELLPHGQHSHPAYAGGDPGQSSPQDRPDAVIHGTLARFGKRHVASGTPQAFGWIKACYSEALELETRARQTPFGLGPNKDKFKNVDALFIGLQEALGQAQETHTSTASEVPA